MHITYQRAATPKELQQIVALQQANLKTNLPINKQTKEGFLTVSHSYELLKKMNDACPHIIAKKKDEVVGYALVMLPEFKNEIPTLIPLFTSGALLLDSKKFLVMGQICVSKKYRKKGIFRGMYTYYQQQLSPKYDCLLTEVATDNKRSLQAHISVGFSLLKTQITDGISWELINWDWK